MRRKEREYEGKGRKNKERESGRKKIKKKKGWREKKAGMMDKWEGRRGGDRERHRREKKK